MDKVCVQGADFDVGVELAELRQNDPRVGAVCCFVGTVRDHNEGDGVQFMELEHYPGMTERSIADVVVQARGRFDFYRSTVIHRVGRLALSDQIVLVAVTSAHRAEAFRACEFIMDHLKTKAPFWKKEHSPEGTRWVDARHSDAEAQQRWDGP